MQMSFKHKGEEAWLFGKGPSLDSFSMEDAGKLRATVNHACFVVPEPTYCFSCFEDYQEIKPPVGCDYITGEGKRIVGEIKDYSIGDLFLKYSSAELAASYLISCGIAVLHLIGFDPARKYSSQFTWGNRELSDEDISIRFMIKNNIQDMAALADVDVYDYGSNA